MDVKQGPFGPYEDVIKSEPDVSSQIEGNYCTYTNQQMFNNDHDSCLFDDKDDIFCEHQTTEQSPTMNSLNVGEIKQEIIECEESKIEYRPCDLPTKVEHDSVCEKEQLVSTTVKKELNIHDVVDVSEVIAKQEVTENIQAKTESELLTSYCDLPTLKCESAEYSDNLVQPCSSKHAERTLKTLKTETNVSKKKRRRYPCAVCQKGKCLVFIKQAVYIYQLTPIFMAEYISTYNMQVNMCNTLRGLLEKNIVHRNSTFVNNSKEFYKFKEFHVLPL